jgi:TolB-like protein/Tfp pilus assembly protein PilF
MGIQTPPPTDGQGLNGARLDGWKEIAAYLNRHVATVRRWEKTEALPVHRHVHDKIGSVYAFRGELDAWWRSRRAQLEAASGADMPPEGGAAGESIDRPPPDAATAPVGAAASAGPEDGTALGTAAVLCHRPDEAGGAYGSGTARARSRWSVLAGVLALALATAAYAVSRNGHERRTEIRSLAVLPLQNLSNDAAQDYFADGMTDVLITNLAQIHALRVISRTSVMRFKGSQQPLPQIARELGVDAIIEGSVQRSGDRVKITMQLVDGASDHHIWAQEYERDLSDVLTLQGDLARAVADEIRTRVTAEERLRLASAQTIDPAAHEAFLLGRYHAWKMNEDDLRLAITHFERAIQIHPRYAAAYADLSLAWQYRSVFAATPLSESDAPARAAAQMALALDAGLAAAHMATGHLKYVYDLAYAGAESDFRRAVELDPGSVDAHYYYAKLLQSLGRFPEAIHHMERARDVDPLSSSVASFLGRTLYRAGKYDEAIPHLRRAIELEPRNILAHTRLAETYEEMRHYDEALAYHEREYERTANLRHLARIARLQARMGKRDQARRTLEQLDASDDGDTGEVIQARVVAGGMTVERAAVHAATGDADEAFRLLMQAIDARDYARLLFIKFDPPFASLRSDPRWKDVLERMNLASDR